MTRQDVEQLRQRIELGGGVEKVDQQHAKGKLTARERLELLLDSHSFLETDVFTGGTVEGRETPGEGVVTGFGTIDGRPVYVFSQDFTVLGGSLGRVHAAKICKVLDQAAKVGVPVVALLDSAGARLQEGLDALAGYGEVYRRLSRYSGAIPLISVVCGPCIGGAAYLAALTDFVFLAGKDARLQNWGPQVTAAALGAIAPADENGTAQFRSESEQDCLARVRELVGLLPANNVENGPVVATAADLNREAPELNALVPGLYDMNMVIAALADDGGFFAASSGYAPSLLTGFFRLNGRTVGVVANQPKAADGVLDGNACVKAARFIGFCDGFHIPLLTLVDTSGLVLDAAEENAGLVGRAAALIGAYASATVAKVSVVCGRAPGSAFAILGNRALGVDTVYAWPGAEISVVAPETAVNILYSGEIAAAENPQEARGRLVQRYKEQDSNPMHAAQGGFVDDIIAPAETRKYVAAALEMLLGKREAPAAGKRDTTF